MTRPYEGVHEFLLIRWNQDPQARIEAILRRWEPDRESGPLFSAAVLAEGGDFGGFAHFGRDTSEELGELNAELWNEGIRSDYDTEGKVYKDSSGQPLGPRRHSPTFGALCRFVVDQQPLDVLGRIGDHWEGKVPFVGASQLLRRSRLLVQLGDEDKDALLGSHVPELRQLPGVVQDDFRVGIIDPGASAA